MTEVRSHLTGSVNRFYIEDGASVEAEEKLICLESMKMMFDIYAPASGVVRLKCQLGQIVKRNELLAVIE